MNLANESSEITILRVTTTSEHFLKLDYISAREGLTYGLLRYSPKNKNVSKPDLFDTAEILSDNTNKANKFLKICDSTEKRTNIGKAYNRLNCACCFSHFILDNVSDVPDPNELYQLTKKTLNAFNSDYSPEIVFIKAIYTFLRIEGFPVDREWWKYIPKTEKESSKTLLKNPLSSNALESEINLAIRLRKLLAQWIQKTTDLKISQL